ncbi:sensor histidine kinase [Catenulispora subtropica]|uniref:histidine kinase n=1 Tax=Catenulispora subtropica TaxID=450798 RepID=A0ABN2S7H3_9ACTN
MAVLPRFAQLRRVAPSAWMILAWVAATGYALWLSRSAYLVTPVGPPALRGPEGGVPLGAGSGPGFRAIGPGTELPILVGATVATVAGSVLLRRLPLVALGFLLAGAVAASLVFRTPLTVLLEYVPADIALWCFADRGPRRTSAVALAMAAATWAGYVVALRMLADAGMVGVLLRAGPSNDYFSLAAVVALSGLVFWLAGVSGRQARAHAVSQAAAASAAERLRLSRDLHDSVAHDIGIIAVLAGAGARVLDTRPEAAREALAGIETTSRETLTGLQHMLRTLRQDGARADPGLLDVERLAARASGAGVRVELTWSGERRTLPPEIDRSAYRIIQEAVTNVVRHSGTNACHVAVGFEPGALAIEIVDEGRPPAADASAPSSQGGFGLLGMRERVTMLSGQFSAGPRPEGGFRVAARLPA